MRRAERTLSPRWREAMLRLMLALILLLAAMSGAGAQCLPAELAEARVRAVVPADAIEIDRHEGRDAAVVLARINAEPPETDFAADLVLIIHWRGQPGAVILLALEGCLVAEVILPATLARRLSGRGGA